jgi:hypothetical protein
VTGRPTRATVAGRAYLDLQNLARKQGRPTDELHQIHALEGFLARLVASPYADRFVLKGGVLLAAYDTRRPTRDVDLLGQHISNDTEQVLSMVRTIAAVQAEDGLVFDAHNAMAETIRDEDVYGGVRVTLTGELSVAKLSLHVDVNVGDPIWPAMDSMAAQASARRPAAREVRRCTQCDSRIHRPSTHRRYRRAQVARVATSLEAEHMSWRAPDRNRAPADR